MTATDGLDPALFEFVELFNQRRFWDAHEALEDAWRATRSDFYQALILYASAFVHAQRANEHGVVAQLGKARPKLAACRPAYLGFDVDAMLEHAGEATRVVQRGEGEDWQQRVLPPRLDIAESRVRGDERELGPAAE